MRMPHPEVPKLGLYNPELVNLELDQDYQELTLNKFDASNGVLEMI